MIDLAKMPAKKERKVPIRWSTETQELLMNAVYKELRNPDKDQTTAILHILQRKITELLPEDERRVIPSLQSVPFVKEFLKRKIREDLKTQQDLQNNLTETQNLLHKREKVTPDEKVELIQNYLKTCPVEDLESIVAKRKSIRAQEIENKSLEYLKEIQTQIHLNNAEVMKITQKVKRFGGSEI